MFKNVNRPEQTALPVLGQEDNVSQQQNYLQPNEHNDVTVDKQDSNRDENKVEGQHDNIYNTKFGDMNMTETDSVTGKSIHYDKEVVEMDSVVKKPPQYDMEEEENKIRLMNKRALSKHADTYQLELFETKLLVIFNHMYIEDHPRRIGTEKDVMALKETFLDIGFQITIHNDLRLNEVFQVLDSMKKEDFTKYGCVAVAVLTYGSSDGNFQATDQRFYSEADIILSLNKNPTLVTKPKILILQASRCGLGEMNFERLRDSRDHDKVYLGSRSIENYSLPLESDLLIIHSSCRGSYSFRTQSGSWFIQTLCSKIKELAETEDLESILIHVKRVVATLDYKTYDSSNSHVIVNKQMPVTTSTLLRKLYLRKKQDDPVKYTPITRMDLGLSTPRLLNYLQRSSLSLSSRACIPNANNEEEEEYVKKNSSKHVINNSAVIANVSNTRT